MKNDLIEKLDVVKAVWSTAYVNNLPDAAFAYVEPGGKKDAEGKTVPRSLRHLPHHGPNVKSPTENSSVDLPHLRNSLARAPQMNFPDAVKNKAIAHLEAHAKELLATYEPKKPAQVAKSFWGGVI